MRFFKEFPERPFATRHLPRLYTAICHSENRSLIAAIYTYTVFRNATEAAHWHSGNAVLLQINKSRKLPMTHVEDEVRSQQRCYMYIAKVTRTFRRGRLTAVSKINVIRLIAAMRVL